MKFVQTISVLLVCFLLAFARGPASEGFAQELSNGNPAATEGQPTGDAEDEATADTPQASEPATTADDDGTKTTAEESSSSPNGEDADVGPEFSGEFAAETVDGATAGAAEGDGETSGTTPFAIVALLVALFVLPVLIGNWLANRAKMPDYGWKISLMLGTVLAAGIILYFGQFKFGPDLAGGVTLIYELADTKTVDDGQQSPEDDQQGQSGPSRELVRRLTEALKQRVDPTGTKEVTIRPYGSAIEIIIPKTSPDDLEFVKRRITSLGQLEFRIVADPNWGDRDRNIIEQAKALPLDQRDVELNGEKVAEWVAYSVEEFGPVGEDSPGRPLVKRMGVGDRPEALVLMDTMNVTGEYLDTASKTVDERGGPAVRFVFDSRGSRRFGSLTGENKPNPATGYERHLGIILDKRLLSAPGIQERITGEGRISGGAMTDEEVEFIISILDAGSLPAALNPEPLSEEIISATIGQETVEKGSFAIAVSLAAVLVFMVFYYHFAGLVACLALVTNLTLVLGVMVLINAAFTLPGLAGLVLTVGMSVDANVLIFERIREELNRGSALRMAIRNGFGRATTTIVDANVTTLITGVVLYAIGTDQIKGFAVTLILGIMMSMYTAIFCSRVTFDIAERRRWITKLSMLQIIGNTSIDFIGKRYVAGAFSAVLIAIGLVGVFNRGSGILNIDFTGGTSVTMVLTEDNKSDVEGVRSELEQTELNDSNLTVVERGESKTRFTVNTSRDSVEEVEGILTDAFSGRLKTYDVELGEVEGVQVGGVPGAKAVISINASPGNEESGVGYDSMLNRVNDALKSAGHSIDPALSALGYTPGSAALFKEWTVELGLDPDSTRTVLESVVSEMTSQPMFPLANKIGSKVAGDLQVQALYAIFVSLLGIVGYLWLRFQKVTFGFAAVIALVHDVLVTLGMIALSSTLVSTMPAVADALQIDSFQISLPIVAAFLTIIGYSLNDTIVVFDRIREVRGKSPQLTAEMINTSINQTLGRTLLTSLTTLLVVLILYFAGGAGIHGFAFALVVGVIVGTYSSIFVASPALLAMSGGGGSPRTE